MNVNILSHLISFVKKLKTFKENKSTFLEKCFLLSGIFSPYSKLYSLGFMLIFNLYQ